MSLTGTLREARLLDLGAENALLDQWHARTNWRVHWPQMSRTDWHGHGWPLFPVLSATSVAVGVDIVKLADELIFAGGTGRSRGLSGAVAAQDVHRSAGTGLYRSLQDGRARARRGLGDHLVEARGRHGLGAVG